LPTRQFEDRHISHSLDSLIAVLARTAETRANVPLAPLSRWRIGGNAAVVVEPASADEVAAVVRTLRDHGAPYVVIGDGSNILFDDDGLSVPLIRIGRKLGRIERLPDRQIGAQAGVWVPCYVRRAISY
jgi:UDP-N-acetylmuramate dehydrogenase